MPAGTSEWVPFQGTVKFENDYAILSGQHGGVIRMAKKNVKMEGTAVAVKTLVGAKIIEQPKKQTKLGVVTAKSGGCDSCGNKKCACIGCVRVCCGSGGTRGICIGVWGC